MQQQLLKHRHDIHFTRKLWHCIGICMIAVSFNFLSLKINWLILCVISLIIIPADLIRKNNEKVNKAALRLFGPVMRRHEYHNVSGFTYLLFGCAFLLLLREKHIVTLTLLFLAFGDPIASFFGIRYGKDPIIGNKTLQGTLAGFFVCTVIAGLYYYFNNLMTERLLIVAPLSGLIGAFAELVPVGKLDDNLTFPVISAVLLWTLFKVYGGLGI